MELTQKEIIVGCISIADLIGYEVTGPGFPSGIFFEGEYYHFEDFKLHSSWDRLMPVVQYINMLDDYRYTVQIMSMDVYIHDNLNGGYIFQSECKWQCDELINSVFEAVVNFAEWYKQQK